MDAEPRSATGPFHERMRSRIELREWKGSPALVGAGLGCALLLGAAFWTAVVTATVTWLGLPRIGAIALVVLGAVGLLVALFGGLALVARLRPVTHVIELAPPGAPHRVALLSPTGAALGDTRDGSLVVRDAQYLRSARGGAQWRAAVVLEVRGAPVGALACLGPADVRPGATQIDTPRLGDLYPRELEYLRAR